MKIPSLRIAVFLIAIFGALSTFAQDKPLTNDDVISLSKSGVAAEIIVAKVRSTPGKFDTSTDQLKALKDAGVADSVVLAMVQFPQGSKSSAPTEAADDVIPNETKAVIYVYRRKEFDTRNLQPSVYADDVEVARMDDGKFFIIKLDPGKHNIVVNKGFSGAAIDMKAGHRYYFRVTYKPGFLKARSEMEYVAYEQGKLEVANMKPLEDKWIKDKTRVSVSEPKP
ncbi:MAG: DUF2846 domain-containing protein [Acidobacteria bacterium]|nr:DUF2846 domain-containing protein [Acidobacteriota bacterium]